MQIRSRISPKERLQLERLARRDGRSIGDVVRDAVMRYIEVRSMMGSLTDAELSVVKFNTAVSRLRKLQVELDKAVFKIPLAKRGELAEVANTLDQLLSYIDEEATCPGPADPSR